MKENGFKVTEHDLSYKALNQMLSQMKVPRKLSSCHTAIVDGYIVEGHVPVQFIKKLLRDKPDIAGIAVPGMPAGSPGMGGAPATPAVWSFTKQGEIKAFKE
ncbi:DUF411 domain-containing protein [Dongshaea marina]|uniref:DUF411 domain-containing protein n=1 Tax=Dongshaea marina TaxID=2047966 RepID=UPI000D3ED3F6|nr:DUF411 domain-containing protein [Dongshaea marina]